jgi:putative adhesin
MITRSGLIAVLVVVEVALVGEMVYAVVGDRPVSWHAPEPAQSVRSALAEGGAHRIFDAGSNPALTVDIGYADLTIRAGSSSQFDVSLSKSTDLGVFRTTAPITAREDGDTVRVAVGDDPDWTTGDDRRVTVIVPPDTHVTVVKAGNIEVSGLRAEASIKSVGHGSIAVDDYHAPALDVDASDGAVSLHEVAAPRVEVKTDGGSVDGTGLQVGDGMIESTDGPVTLGFTASADTVVNAQTGDGTIGVSGLASAAPATTTKADEDSNDSPSSRTVRLGAGAGRLDVHSSDGNIFISQEG